MTEVPFGLGAIIFVGGYLGLLLVLGYLAKRRGDLWTEVIHGLV